MKIRSVGDELFQVDGQTARHTKESNSLFSQFREQAWKQQETQQDSTMASHRLLHWRHCLFFTTPVGSPKLWRSINRHYSPCLHQPRISGTQCVAAVLRYPTTAPMSHLYFGRSYNLTGDGWRNGPVAI